jgi:energy-coupling factor transport system substrate-specific component
MQKTISVNKKWSPRKVTAMLLIFVAIPVAILLGALVMENKNYNLISMLVVVLALLSFLLIFENRKPQVRELVIIAVMVAISVAGRAAFFMTPQVKPVIAVIIVAGICLGGEAGFVVGALTALVSNLIFGQGPWTAWQMFGMGAIGFIAGVLFYKGPFPKKVLPISIFSGIAVMIIYGPIMDTASALMMSPELTWKILWAFWIAGAPLNAINAVSTAGFLLIISKPMIWIMDRVRIKYGLLDNQ